MRMQVCDCLVRLGGETNSVTTPKFNITVAEAIVLNQIHGKGMEIHISRINNVRTIEQPAVREKARLAKLYHVGPQDPDKPGVVDRLFPGMTPEFPANFRDVFPVELFGAAFPKHDPHADRAKVAEDEFEYVDDAAGMTLEEARGLPERERTDHEMEAELLPLEGDEEAPPARVALDGDLGLTQPVQASAGGSKPGKTLSLKAAEAQLAKTVGAQG